MQGLERRRGWWCGDGSVGVWVPLGAKYRLGEGLSSEQEAQEAETQMFRYPSQTPGNCSGVSFISSTQSPVLDTHSLGVCWESEG